MTKPFISKEHLKQKIIDGFNGLFGKLAFIDETVDLGLEDPEWGFEVNNAWTIFTGSGSVDCPACEGTGEGKIYHSCYSCGELRRDCKRCNGARKLHGQRGFYLLETHEIPATRLDPPDVDVEQIGFFQYDHQAVSAILDRAYDFELNNFLEAWGEEEFNQLGDKDPL